MKTLMHCWWDYKIVQPLWKTVWRYLQNAKSTVTILLINSIPRIENLCPCKKQMLCIIIHNMAMDKQIVA